ncbi:MAG: hypothetical protein OES25_09625 [Acidobacteriota bacterium]|nr:hypothetical protein [Acidobacteriota bacterium]
MSVVETFNLKPISREAVAEALKKAERYRLLNEPTQAESICRDVLRVDPDNQQALVQIVLTLTDRFGRDAAGVRNAREYAGKLQDDYARTYYSALISERHARALLAKGMSSSFAYDGLREAMDGYEAAETLRPAGHDDAILRWNSCVRTIRRANLRPRDEDDELPLE